MPSGMHQNGPQREPSYWTEKMGPKGAEQGTTEGAKALGRDPKPGTQLPECTKMDPKGNHFFCPITLRVIGQKQWAQRGPKKEQQGDQQKENDINCLPTGTPTSCAMNT